MSQEANWNGNNEIDDKRGAASALTTLHEVAEIIPTSQYLEINAEHPREHTSILRPQSTSVCASRETPNVVELQMIMIKEMTIDKANSERDVDLIPTVRRRSVMMSKQNVNGPRNTICQNEKGPCRDTVTTL